MSQRGHVATRQVEAAGLTRPALRYQVRVGLLEPVLRGVYRFTTFPPSDREREAAVLLWAGADVGVAVAFGHETALQRYDLGDAFPAKLHLTVPIGFRRRPPADTVLRYAELAMEDVVREDLLAYTTLLRTLLDLLEAGFPLASLQETFLEALDRGLVRRGALAPDGPHVAKFLERLTATRVTAFRGRLARLLEEA
jgi:predicted transcriptional regulator of viral defense system